MSSLKFSILTLTLFFFCFYSAGELEELVREVKGQLKKIAITSSNRKDKVFLDIDMNRQGFIGKENLQEMCLKQHLPAPALLQAKTWQTTKASLWSSSTFCAARPRVVDGGVRSRLP